MYNLTLHIFNILQCKCLSAIKLPNILFFSFVFSFTKTYLVVNHSIKTDQLFNAVLINRKKQILN